MQNPVIQRIKRRAEVCRSLPVTCGRRGNDTGNYLVTAVSLQCAVDCFPENGKSPHSKPFTFLLLPAAKCRLSVFFTCGPAFVCGLCTEQGSFHVGCQSFARPWKYGCHRKGICQIPARNAVCGSGTSERGFYISGNCLIIASAHNIC